MMIIGVPKEIKKQEFRVSMTPSCVKEYVANGHTVLTEKGAGIGAGFDDSAYEKNGAFLINSHEEIFERSQMIVKVKEPLKEEFNLLRKEQILYTYLHLAANRDLALNLLEKEVHSVAYETIGVNRSLPCLNPMSEIAGKLAVQEGARFLEKQNGGRGTLLGGVAGVLRGEVVILGAGVVGSAACKVAVGMGANVTVLNRTGERLATLENIYGTKVQTLFATKENILTAIKKADLVIGAVLIKGATTPKLVSKQDLKVMKKASVIVDVAIDQGGCFETSKLTYHDNPIYTVEDIIHYCVGNIPGAVPITSTQALTAVTLSYGLEIANRGLIAAAEENRAILNGINTYGGDCTNKAVADSLGLKYHQL